MNLSLKMGEYVAGTHIQTNPLKAAEIYDSLIEKCESASKMLARIEARLNRHSNQLESDASQFRQKLRLYTGKRNQCLRDFAALLPEDGSV